MSIGKVLKEEREKKHLTLEDVSKETLVRVYYLEKIENDDFGSEFDGYMLSYVRKYAEALGIDPTPLINEYRELFKGKEEILKPRKNYKRLTILIVVLLIISAIIFGVTRSNIFNKPITPTNPNNQEISSGGTQTQNPSSQNPSEGSKNPETQPINTNPSEEPKPQYPINLILKSDGRCWLGITIDGKYSQRFINKGETLELHANQYIQIRFGNAKVVKVNLNGKDLGLASTTNTVAEYKYTEKGAEKINTP